MTFFRRPKTAAIGSPRWWRNALTDVGLRLAAPIFLIVLLATGQPSGVAFWIGIAGAVAMVLLLVFPVMVCVIALRDPARLEQQVDRGADT